MKTLTSSEVAVLGLLAERPRYGYEIDRVIEDRGMREWVDIGFSSIYATLKTLEEDGFVEGKLELSDETRARKRYFITMKGREGLKRAVKELLSNPERKVYKLDLGISNILALSSDEAREALKARMESLMKRSEFLKRQRASKAPPRAPYFVKALFDRPLAFIDAEIRWLEEFIKEIK